MNRINRWLFSFRRWWMGRQWWLLLPGLPALMVGLAALSLIGFAVAEGNRDLTARYLNEAKTRFKNKDYDGALTCYERLANQAIDRPDVIYGLARAAEACGYHERAVVLMRELALPGEKGYPEAHLWWARHLLRFGGRSSGNLDLIEKHLLHAIDGRVEERETAHGLLGELYVSRGQLDKAEPHLRRAVELNPQLYLRLAQIYYTRGDTQLGRTAAEQAANFFQAWVGSDLYSQAGRLGLADARILLGDYPGAIAALQEGLKATDEVEYRRAMSRVYVAWTRHVAETKKDSLGEQLALVEKALASDPSNQELVMRIWAMTTVKGKEAEQAFAILRKQLASGKATALTHLALGMHEWENQNQEGALIHLEQAYKLAPEMAFVANNLAWVLANSQPPDLKRALSLINSVLERHPDQPMFRDTRAHVHYLNGSWKEALNDYQAALPFYANSPDYHKRLADVYGKLGMKEMAKEHGTRAEELLSKAKKP